MLCVIAKVDPRGTERLRKLQDAACAFGPHSPPLYGHITIAAYTGDDEPAFIGGSRELLRDTGPFSVVYDRIEVLSATSVLVAAPRRSGVLLSVHDRIAARYGSYLDRWTGGGWYPHTTLLYDPRADLPGICRAVRETFSPFEALVESIEFSRADETGYEIVGRIALG